MIVGVGALLEGYVRWEVHGDVLQLLDTASGQRVEVRLGGA